MHLLGNDIPEISIHAAREGGDAATIYTNTKCGISIHAAREGGDYFVKSANILIFISIHAAREGGDLTRNTN